MKQNFLFYISTLMLFCTSCQKVLDKKPLDAFTESDVWNSTTLAEGYLFTTYADVIGSLYYTKQAGPDDWTDDIAANYPPSSVANIRLENIDNSFDAGWNQYGNIRRCNLIIQELKQSTRILPADVKTMTAEAQFLRALTYYYMAQRFGGVMLVDSVYTDATKIFQFPRASIDSTYDFILKDLDDAANNLPPTTASGRATQAAAYAMITRVGLQAAAYVPEKKSIYLKDVIGAAKAIIDNLGTYNLAMDPNYGGMFNDYSTASTSPELILGYFQNATNTIVQNTPMQWLCPNQGPEKLVPGYGPPFTESFEGWMGRCPTEELIDAYLANDNGIAKEWNETSSYQNYETNGGYVSQVMYKNRDKRFYATITYDSTMLYKNFILTRDFGNMNRLSDLGGWGPSLTNYYFIKGLYQNIKLANSLNTNYIQPIIRLGEVYLNYAEALLLNNDLADAIIQINQTRTIHGGLPALSGGSMTDLWNIYKNERRVEMVLENDRYWSLLRWGMFENEQTIPELNGPINRIDISQDGKTFSFANVEEQNNSNRKFTNKRYLFPVPLGETQANPNLLPNNMGW